MQRALTAIALGFAVLGSGPAWAGSTLLDQRAGLITHPGGGAGGADESRLQSTSLGMTTIGFGVNNAANVRLADDVVFNRPVDIDTITVYTYQTGSTTTSTITGLVVQVFDRPPSDPAAVVLFGDTTTNRLGSTAFTNIFRVTETTVGNTTRPIMSATTVDLNLTLPAGTYWIAYGLTGSLASGPWAPPLTTLGSPSAPGANGLQFGTGGVWAPMTDGGTGMPPQGVPFTITGTLPPFADGALAIDNGGSNIIAGASTSHTLAVGNVGPDPLVGLGLQSSSVGLTPTNWTCTVVSNASCPSPASGVGEISVSVDVGIGGGLLFTLESTATAPVGQTATRSVQATLPVGITDPDSANNSASDVDNIVSEELFSDGFEDVTGVLSVIPGLN